MASFWGDSLTVNMVRDALTPRVTNRQLFNGGVGGEISTAIKTRFLASGRRQITFIWAGNNNPEDTATVTADVAAMVAELSHTDYLVLGVINGDYANRKVGGADYENILATNATLEATYGDKYYDIRTYLMSHYDPNSPQDVQDIADGIIPSSLRVDTIHLTPAGDVLVAEKVIDLMGLDANDP
jgi:hypothetical protein